MSSEPQNPRTRYESELPEDIRLYDKTNPVCRYYHITRRTAVLNTIADAVTKLTSPEVFVDLGCGSGAYTRLTSGAFRTRIGLDVALHKLVLARATAGPASTKYIAASVCEVPLATASADLVLCTEVVEHFPQPIEILNEIARIARPGAMLVLSSPARLDFRALAMWIAGTGPTRSLRLRSPDMHGHYWYFAPDDLAQIVRAAGFHILHMSAVPKIHFPGLPRLLRWRLVSDKLIQRLGAVFNSSPPLETFGAFLIVQAQRVN